MSTRKCILLRKNTWQGCLLEYSVPWDCFVVQSSADHIPSTGHSNEYCTGYSKYATILDVSAAATPVSFFAFINCVLTIAKIAVTGTVF